MGNIHENVLRSPNPSGNDNDEGDLILFDHEPRRNSRGQLPRRCFEIDRKALMTIL